MLVSEPYYTMDDLIEGKIKPAGDIKMNFVQCNKCGCYWNVNPGPWKCLHCGEEHGKVSD